MAKPTKLSTKKRPITVEVKLRPEQCEQIASWAGVPMDTKAHVHSFMEALVEAVENPSNRLATILQVDIADRMR